MNEELNQLPEKENNVENGAEQQTSAEVHQSHAEHGHHEKKIDVKHARHEAETEAKSTEQIKAAAGTKDHKPKAEFVGREARDVTYQRTMLKVRRHLSPVSRTYSKLIHQPVVDKVSEVSAKTVARPSGLLGGGIVAFVGTAIYYYLVRHNNYSYNFTVFLLLLAGGFILGWILEIFVKTPKSTK